MVMNMVQNMTGTDALTDQAIATDLLMSGKAGIQRYAMAITESATPDVRRFLQGHLDKTIELHGQITELMMNRGWYHPYDAPEQLKLDINRAQTALNAVQG